MDFRRSLPEICWQSCLSPGCLRAFRRFYYWFCWFRGIIAPMYSTIRIGLLGEFNQQQKAHHAIPKALAAASQDGVETTWVSTDSVDKGATLAEFDGLWCVPGMPYKSADGAISAIRFARTSRLPFLGTSAGFQYTLIEYARHVLGLTHFPQTDVVVRPFWKPRRGSNCS